MLRLGELLAERSLRAPLVLLELAKSAGGRLGVRSVARDARLRGAARRRAAWMGRRWRRNEGVVSEAHGPRGRFCEMSDHRAPVAL